MSADPTNEAPEYKAHPSGVEYMEIAGNTPFLEGSAITALWHADGKDSAVNEHSLRMARACLDTAFTKASPFAVKCLKVMRAEERPDTPLARLMSGFVQLHASYYDAICAIDAELEAIETRKNHV